MTRRTFVASLAASPALVSQAATSPIDLDIDVNRRITSIPGDFIGLGFEISSVAIPSLLSAANRTYVQLVRTLSSQGVIRIGGNTSDYSSFAPDAASVAASKATVVNRANLQELKTFLDATKWRLIWVLNLGSATIEQVVDEAVAVTSATGDKLLAFEIGNEPDLFGHGTAHRAKDYSYQNYLAEYRRYKSAIRARLPQSPFAGPDAAVNTGWVSQFAADEGSDLKLLTHHYYRECANPQSTSAKLLGHDPKLASQLQQLKAASDKARIPYRICEVNSFCGGGRPGVSDTFVSALWALDYMFTLASASASGINMETGLNQLDFVSSYSPIAEDNDHNYSARPEYYGMLAFRLASRGNLVQTEYQPADLNVSAYAVRSAQDQLLVTIINKEESRSADFTVKGGHFSKASAIRLTAPALTSKDGVLLGGASVTPAGDWVPLTRESLPIKSGVSKVHLDATTAVILTLQP